MDHALITVAAIVVSSVISILGTLAVRQRAVGRDEQVLRDLGKDQAKLEQRLDKLTVDVNRIGQIARGSRQILDLASQTGEVPKYVPRDSGEGPAMA